ncbi:MAG: hypothetical protein A4E53_02355 [Pelotomaculum sp. PtaB.Bin104]|nr:MAG: hypothetical protein A4E53_02355 [Pelotomaculum sp. PtaB.Bin104]
MLAASLDAIRTLIKNTFPAVEKIYVTTMPRLFSRPSFFVDLVSAREDDLNKTMYQGRYTWQIVYFAPVDANNNPDKFDQFNTSDTLKAALMNAMTLIGPEVSDDKGKIIRPEIIYHILDVEGGPRDAEVYITIRLEAEFTRPSETYDLMQEIQHLQMIGEVQIN